jgi:hypothetical protein
MSAVRQIWDRVRGLFVQKTGLSGDEPPATRGRSAVAVAPRSQSSSVAHPGTGFRVSSRAVATVGELRSLAPRYRSGCGRAAPAGGRALARRR